jgi:hypothetical protein
METAPILELSREEIVARIEQGARQRRRLSARELLRQYQAGSLDEPGEVADLLALAHLLAEDDPLLAAA